MKLLTLQVDRDFHPAVLVQDHVLDLVLARQSIPLASCIPTSMRAVLGAGAEGLKVIERIMALMSGAGVLDRLRAAGAWRPFVDVKLGPVVPDPDLILSASWNSRGHVAEMLDEPPEWPCAFLKVRSALAGSGAIIIPPPGHRDMIDWEGEFCVVIGKTCHCVNSEQALDYVAGYTLLNDISARDYALPFIKSTGHSPAAQAWERNVLGKNFPTFAPIGPVITTRDDFSSPVSYHMETLVNGHVMQSSTQDDLIFGPERMIAYFSQFYVFQPGDIISMGSPPGVGMARKPQLFLKQGDTVEVRLDGIGSLVNRVG